MSSTFIDTTPRLVKFLDNLPDCNGQPPSLYVDLEGNNLSRQGTLSIVTILVQPLKETFLIDVTTLGGEAFTAPSTKGTALKDILDLHGIHVEGIEDLQLFELASRSFDKTYVNGLARCIGRDLDLSYSEQRNWQVSKEQGKRLFAPELGGSYAIFDERPMAPEMIEYCTQDVAYMPRLREVYLDKLCDSWWLKIVAETENRVRLSQEPSYHGHGRHKALAPSEWRFWKPNYGDRDIRTLFYSSPSKVVEVLATVPSDQVGSEQDEITTLLSSLAVAEDNVAEDDVAEEDVAEDDELPESDHLYIADANVSDDGCNSEA